MTEPEIPKEPRQLRLDQFLQLSGTAQTGGHAKLLIQGGQVTVNGEPETRRKRKLAAGDVVGFEDNICSVDEFL